MSKTITKQNGNVAFYEDTHTYEDLTDSSKVYTSVTTLIHKFAQPFHKDFWSGYKALERIMPSDLWEEAKVGLLGVTKKEAGIPDSFFSTWKIDRKAYNVAQQNILDEWQRNNLESTERGSKIHANMEDLIYQQHTDISLQKYGIGGKFECNPANRDCKNPDTSISGLYPELLIYYDSPDGKFNIAGQIDLFIRDGNKFSLIDWKTNKEIKTKSYVDKKTKQSEKMKYPLNDLDDCNYSQYTMQLSTYAWMIMQKHPELELSELKLIHFDHKDNMTIYTVDYLKDQVERMLEYWRKENVLQQHRAKNQKIEY